MKISVITATFNSGKTVRDTVESVLRQTHQEWELIIKDGGSTDNTLEICHDLSEKANGRIKIISSPDKGIYDAMNQGLDAASGEVVGLLNSDDFYTSKDVLETISSSFENGDMDAVYGDIHFVRDGELDKCIRYYSSAHFCRKKMMLGYMPAHPSFYCKRDVYLKYGLFDTSYKVAADFEQLLRLIYIGQIKTKYLKKDFVTMRDGGASTAGIGARMTIMREHLRAFREHGIKNNVFRLSLRYFDKLTEYLKKE